MSKINQTSIEVNTLEWNYLETTGNAGNGETMLLLHGIPAQNYTWTGLMPLLSDAGYRTIAPDWIGCGNSSKPEKQDFPYTPAAFITALGELIDKLELEKFTLVVQGFLATNGIEYAIANPDRIDKLIILNSPLNESAKLPIKIQQLGWPVAGEMLTQDPLATERTLEAGCKFVIDEKILNLYRKPFLKSTDAGRALLAIVRNLQLKQSLPKIATGLSQLEVPIQIIWGMQDPWLQLDRSIERASITELATAAHYPQEHHYPDIAKAILAKRSSI
jgi:pimeloyl-ACP methyl ester carboxylesterase